ncbi:hypothetical protein CEXT_295081 [Caerostris extrusa]|uniref:Uncharacterized protein n=1 Tax=Caerostris extrusa TaxID=172846 RepID=A0AAV4RRY7_CAEEX|nr:hypothetical protein CEXT_295081 [Caerostris extrusa]
MSRPKEGMLNVVLESISLCMECTLHTYIPQENKPFQIASSGSSSHRLAFCTAKIPTKFLLASLNVDPDPFLLSTTSPSKNSSKQCTHHL